MPQLDVIANALTHGRIQVAGQVATSMFEGNGDHIGQARDLGRLLRKLYLDFHVRGIHEFCRAHVAHFSSDISAIVLEPVKPELDLTEEWSKRLDSLADERLSNELAECIKAAEMREAEEVARALFSVADTPENLARRARYIGGILGSLVHEQKRAAGLVQRIVHSPQTFGIDSEVAQMVEAERQRSAGAAARRERPVGALNRTELTQAAVEISRSLPGRMAIQEPKPEECDGFMRTMSAIIRCCLLSYRHNRFHEATMLMVEFSPKEVSAAGAMAGVEQRLHPTLGRTARSVAARVFRELGETQRVFEPYMDFAKEQVRSRVGPYCVEALGLLRNPESVKFIVEAMADRGLDVRTEALFALGTIGDEQAEKILFDVLQEDVSGRVIEGPARREAMTVLSSLARIGRRRGAAGRSEIVARALKIIPRDDMGFTLHVLLSFFTGKVSAFQPEILDWAARTATAALWNLERPELKQGAQKSPLGYRQPLIDLLEHLAPHSMSAINETASENIKSYSGAYLALAEFYAKVPDPSSIPVLKQMFFNTFLHEAPRNRSAYQKETVFDPATEEHSELKKDRVLAALIYAVDKIGGEDAQDLLADLFDQMQSGHLPRPGKETADILMDAHMRSAKRRGVSAFPSKPETAAEVRGPEADVIPSITEEDERLISELTAGYLFAGKRREKKVAAMAALAHRKILAAVPAIIDHLSDKDNIIASAAITALVDFGSGAMPVPLLRGFHDELINALARGENVTRVKLVEVLTKLKPRKSPLKDRLERLRMERPRDLALNSMVAKILGDGEKPRVDATPVPRRTASPAAVTVSPGDMEKPAQKSSPDKPAKPDSHMDQLEKRRAYLLARQEWIRGGKQGKPPEPPA
jgi:hypothetical protein